MTRFSLATLLAASLAGPWSGCDRTPAPVTPPTEPPAERAPDGTVAPTPRPTDGNDGGVLLLPATRRLG